MLRHFRVLLHERNEILCDICKIHLEIDEKVGGWKSRRQLNKH